MILLRKIKRIRIKIKIIRKIREKIIIKKIRKIDYLLKEKIMIIKLILIH